MPETSTIVIVVIISGLLCWLIFSIYRLNKSEQKIKTMSSPPNNSNKGNSIDEAGFSDIRKEIERLENLLNIELQTQLVNPAGLVARLENLYEVVKQLKQYAGSASQTLSASRTELLNDVKNRQNINNKDDLRRESSVLQTYYSQSMDAAATILQIYNQAVADRTARPKFWSQYSYVTLGNVNAVDQRLGTASKAEFREVSNGDFIAIRLKEEKYFVFLQFDLTLTPQKLKGGGISSAFELPGYDGHSSHSNIEIKKPAIFERFGSEWKLIQKGTIVL